MPESTQPTSSNAAPAKERFAFLKNLPARFPRTTKTFAAIGVVATGVVATGVVKGLKKTDVTVAYDGEEVLDTSSSETN